MAPHITSSHLTPAPAPAPADPATLTEREAAPALDRLMAAAEVAAVLGVPRSFVYSLARRGGIPTVRLGGRYVRFRADAIRDWIAEREQAPRRWA